MADVNIYDNLTDQITFIDLKSKLASSSCMPDGGKALLLEALQQPARFAVGSGGQNAADALGLQSQTGGSEAIVAVDAHSLKWSASNVCVDTADLGEVGLFVGEKLLLVKAIPTEYIPHKYTITLSWTLELTDECC